ncbi:MAG TPA: OB-fold domain-containing protein [Desulfobacterales bacterium]|nr:OB-fold domain-containing protein [Desulfobacterales bacterium]
MIGYIEGKILKKEEDRVLVLANQIGYEILLPTVVMETLKTKKLGDQICLYIYYQQTERQPKPVLIGFNSEAEKEFFQRFISVEDIGPLKAVKALNIPIRDIARAIETKNMEVLNRLKGIGNRTAQKIIATLEGRMGKYALIPREEHAPDFPPEDFSKQVLDVLTSQLGYKMKDASQMIIEAMRRNDSISSPEELFEEVYRGVQNS